MKLSIKFFHWRVIVNITVELKWTQLLPIAHSPSNKIFNAKADMQRQFPSNFFIEDKHKVYPLLSIKITEQTKHTQLRSIVCISQRTSFKWMEENMNLSRTIVFRTKLFFWQVCVCSAKGDTPLDPRFSFLSSFSLIKSSCHFSFFSLVSEHNACRFWLVEFEFGSFVFTWRETFSVQSLR